MFRQMDLKGQTQADTQLKTTHQNTISTIRAYEEANGSVIKFSSKEIHMIYPNQVIETDILLVASGVDGRVVIWSI